ncbi:MAG: phage integrase N-terminal SAM-like domain-containing protein, partial [Candidatus Bathyarchaeia archaeon]
MPEKKLADRLREAIRLRGYSSRTEKAYLRWYERYVRFHKLRHPATMGTPQVEAFLSHLAIHEQVSASTQNQALSALLFLYQEVLGIPLGDLHALRAKKSTSVTRNACASSPTWTAHPI